MTSYCEIRYTRDGGNNWSDWTQHSLGDVGAFQTRVIKTRMGTGGIRQGYQIVFAVRVSSPIKRDLLAASIKLENAQ
jgi:hypothetical protein